VGAIVKAVMPGRVGGGWIGNLWFNDGKLEFWNLGSRLLAIVGGLAAAGIYGALTGRNKSNV
jgi:hypothetical protein